MANQATTWRDDADASPASAPKSFLLGRFAKQFADSAISFDVRLPDGGVQRFSLPPCQAEVDIGVEG